MGWSRGAEVADDVWDAISKYIPCRYVPSSTAGHGHLYIDSSLPWVTYEKLLTALKDAGIIQAGYWKRSLERKATFVRPPWIKKPDKITNNVL